jgi:hypothetical protein
MRRAGAVAMMLAVAGYGVMALGSGLDRISVDRPEVADTVPMVFASRALPALWQGAATRGDRPAMEHLARLAVDRAPLQSSSTALYGVTQQQANHAAAADSAFRVAARLGWRVPATQAYWMQQGLISGDFTTAALRFDALLRLDLPVPNLPAIEEVFESNPFAASALIDQMGARPPWLDAYVAETGDLSGDRLSRRLDMLGLMAQAGITTSCDKAAAPSENLVAHGQVAQARQFWALACGGTVDSLVTDGNLAHLQLDNGEGPFRWTYAANGDVTSSLVPDAPRRGQWLEAQNASSVSIPLLRQRIVVAAGQYRVVWSSATGASGPVFYPATGCSHDDVAPLRDIRQSGDGWQANFTVNRNCDGAWLEFWMAGGAQGRLGRIDVMPAAG